MIMRLRQQGYSLVEIGIVLVAISLVLGGSVLVVGSSLRQQHQEANEEYMQAIHDSILAFAATNRTPGVDVVFESVPARVSLTLYVPSGRPVLPCPDLNGDGYEDRNIAISDQITVQVLDVRTNNNPLVSMQELSGRCLDDKGLLPWRTLGTRPYDQWGQMYTYYVDQNFSNAAFGFDQITRASNVFKHLVVPVPNQPAGNFMYLMHTEPRFSGIFEMRGGIRQRAETQPIPSRGSVLQIPGMVLEAEATGSKHLGQALGVPDYSIVAGVPLISDLEGFRNQTERRILGTTPSREVNVFEYLGVPLGPSGSDTELNIAQPVMADGIAFGLVSHGRNGRFGVTYRPEYIPGNVASLFCGNLEAATTVRLDGNREETLNGRRTFRCTVSGLLVDQASCTTGEFARSSCATRNSKESNGIFYVQERSRPDRPLVFDDIVTWMMPGEISDYMHDKGLFPVVLPPVVPYDAPPGSLFTTNPIR